MLLSLFCCCIQQSMAFDITQFSIEDIITDIYDNRIDLHEYENDFEAFYEDMLRLQQNPININTATQHDLEQLYFLSDEQIDAILLYRYSHGALHSVYELQLIRGLEIYDIRNMLPFITIGDAKPQEFYWSDLLHGSHELTMRLDARKIEDWKTTKNKYTGDPFYSNVKYKYNYKNRVMLGLHAEKDVGEQFVGPDNYGFDSYGGYLQVNDVWKFKSIIVGDYKANFGEGLVVNHQLSMGRAYDPLSIHNRKQGIQKYGGNDEFRFFRGVAATLAIGDVSITALYSVRTVDGNIVNDELRTVSTTGYHRTATEIARRRASWQHVAGLNVNYSNRYLDVGATFIENIFKHSLNPTNDYYFHGKAQSVGSLNYRFHNEHWSLFGETALASNTRLGVATINGVKYHPMVDLGFVVSHRYYSPYFDNMYANALSYKSRINNEQSVYFATDINLLKPLKISLSTDIWKGYQYVSLYSTYEKYQVFQSRLQARWKHRDNKHRIVLKWNHSHFISSLSLRSQLEMNMCKTISNGSSPWTFGMNAVQRIEYNFTHPALVLQGGVGVFYAPTYDNRFYLSENDVLYAFGQTIVQGRGLRTFVNMRYEINSHWKIYLKAGNTWTQDPETKKNNSQTDIRLLVRMTY